MKVFNASKVATYHVCVFIKQNVKHWPAKQRASLIERCERFILKLSKISLIAALTDVLIMIDYYQNNLGKTGFVCIESIDFIHEEKHKLNHLTQKFEFNECGGYAKLLCDEIIFADDKTNWNTIVEGGKIYNYTKQKMRLEFRKNK